MIRWLSIAWIAASCAAVADSSPAACVSCHRAETAHFAGAAMTGALSTAKDSRVLRDNPDLAASIGGYSYRITGGILSVSDGQQSMRVPLEWAFGKGTAGQTYLFQQNGHWYESRVSYYASLPGLDITLGQSSITPHNLLEAAGRPTDLNEVWQCFDCHATNAGKPRPLDLSGMTEGVQCERCHGDSMPHLDAMRGGHLAAAPVKKLGKLDAEEMAEFCGQCHRTWAQVAANGPHGVPNVRFQPYRLITSKCYDTADRRIRCTTCHDPHRDLETSPARYDSKCTTCHAAPNRVCRVASKDCTGCHMPKIDLPGAHRKFTDHRIRIVKPNETYPD